MEKELEKRIFIAQDYENNEKMEKDIKEYIKIKKISYPSAIITREFYKGKNVLVRVTQIDYERKNKSKIKKENWLEKEEDKIKEKGINGLGENVLKAEDERKRKEKARGGMERERC